MYRFTTSAGIDLAVQEYGPARAPLTVVLAHCWTLNRHDWQYQVRDLLADLGHGVRLLTWDHRGHGESGTVLRRECTIAGLATDMGELIDAVAATGPLLLAGHSIGGMAMLALAQQRADLFDRVVGSAFVATSAGAMDTITLGMPEMGPRVRAQIPRLLALRSRTLTARARRRSPVLERQLMRRLVFGRPTRPADLALAVDGLIHCPEASVVGFYEDCMRHERAEALAVFDGIPTRVLVGSRDLLTPPTHARRIAAGVRGAELVIAPGAGHMLPLERDALVSGTLVRLARRHLD